MRTGYVFDPRYLAHELELGHPESPARLQAVHDCLRRSGLLSQLTRIEVNDDDAAVTTAIELVHTHEHAMSLDECRPTRNAARAAVGGVLAATDRVIDGAVDNAFCAVRPPGHHAHNNAHNDGFCMGEGFCFFNNVAIGARYSQRVRGLERVLIVDWDYHHGNGTEDVFFSDNTVFYFSTHRLHAYPRTGFPGRTGEGAGVGYNLNYPLPSPQNPYGTVDDTCLVDAFEQGLFPRLRQVGFTPDIIFISAGFDSREGDRLGDFALSDSAFVRATELVMQLAATHCSGRIVSVLEGGYDPEGLASGVSAHIRTLLGSSTR